MGTTTIGTDPARGLPSGPLRRAARRVTILLAAGVLALGHVSLRANAPAEGDVARFTPDDIVSVERAGGWDVSRDGRRAVWVRSSVEKIDDAERRVTRLWLADLVEGGSRPLTRGDDGAASPSISPDGRRVAFSTKRPQAKSAGKGAKRAENQVWILPLEGGEAYPATRLDRDVRAFGWIDHTTLWITAQESRSAVELAREKAGDKSFAVDDVEHNPPVRLFRVDLESGDVRRITDNDDWIDRVAVSPDGAWAVVRAQTMLSYEFDQARPPRLDLVALDGDVTCRIFEDSPLLPDGFRWAADGSGFWFVDDFTNHPRYRNATVRHLWWYDLEDGTIERVDLGDPKGLAGGFAPTPGGVVALLANGVTHRAVRIDRRGDGWRVRELSGEHVSHLDAIATSPDGARVVYRHSTATKPPQWYAADLERAKLDAPRAVTRLNARYDGKPTGRVEVVRWKGALGDEVEGLLHYPLDGGGDRDRPLLLDIHGGPTSADRDTWSQSWSSPVLLWRQRGAYVFQVNYHGSSGYGLEWAESIAGRYYELEIPDIESGVDMLIERGLVDPDKLGTAGWSNGGILSADLVTRTDRYKVASIGAADVEWISDWANVDFGAAFDNYYFGGPPWEIPEVYVDKSPFFRLDRVTTPTIVFTGTEDRNVPPHQSWSLFRAMQTLGKAPVRLVLFPGEPHGLRKIEFQRRKIAEDLAWFDRYLFERNPDDPTVKDGSELERLLALADVARVDGTPGVEVDGRLTPEFVRYEGRTVARFEITRAQWRAFDPGFAVAPGTEDHPVTGIAVEEATRYAAWLAELLEKPVRLPSVEEARALAKAAAGGGNTLDAWAGYAPNPADADRLRELAANVGPSALLRSVGSRPGDGEDPVFDLDGNAAEWAVTEDGEGVATGPSADRASDARSTVEPGVGYVGLRVVVDEGASAP